MTSALKSNSNGEHPVVAWAGILAVVVAILLILWARFEVHGTQDLEDALSQETTAPAATKPKPSPHADRSADETRVDEAVATGRWAAGFTP
ncbi:MAG: hypothetical protein OEZ09_11655 [Betaproteobacteria bacterium]|nr:hypothetical protein [Betaproteobacteria bacterium]MDH4324152.1 hypothetical protein [Betaproteobacteria bacterium]MDH5579101.1 hypothetical protein [Betaproteobacteria bacterium]